MNRLSILIVNFIFLFFCTASICSDYWVDSILGSDLNNGIFEDSAWQTITYSLTQVEGSVSDPAILHLSAGTYSPISGEIFHFLTSL